MEGNYLLGVDFLDLPAVAIEDQKLHERFNRAGRGLVSPVFVSVGKRYDGIAAGR
jgi:hypothetical protein